MNEILTPVQPSALRLYGDWAEEPYRSSQGQQGPVFIKNFRWQAEVETVHGDFKITLHYHATAVVDPKRMNELAYLAGQERLALDLLETMVLEATNGVGYVVLLNPVEHVANAMLALVGKWVEERSHPENWDRMVVDNVEQSMVLLNQHQEFLRQAQCHVNPERRDWGLATPIKPLQPKEPA